MNILNKLLIKRNPTEDEIERIYNLTIDLVKEIKELY